MGDPWEGLAERAVDAGVAAGGEYVEVRVVRSQTLSLSVKNGRPEAVVTDDDEGLGVRVLMDGGWGFACTPRPEPEAVTGAALQAVEVARASRLLDGPAVRLAPQEPVRAAWANPVRRDPWEVPLEEMLALLAEATEAMLRVPGVRVAEGFMDFWRTAKRFRSSEGAAIDQLITESGGGIAAVAVHDGEVQRRSYPASFRGDFGTGGYELVEALDLAGHAQQTAEEAAALLLAPPCPTAVTTLILDGDQTALQIHESVGHAIEFDRILGTEAAYAGTSFITPGDIGSLRYGSEAMHIIADATLPGALGTFGFDDEGVPAQRVVIVECGVLRHVLTNRETALLLGQRSNGAARASSWNRIPLVRMTNVGLLPDSGTLEDLIADTDEGVLMCTNKSWSIDDRRLNFQFGCEIAWEIRRGRRGRLFKQPVYSGITPQFWASLDRVAGPAEFRARGTPNCGKGQPAQVAHTGHPAGPTRFRGVQVGSR
ncbi:MAG: TldD/PmbA family protein [Armatimonadota bacterium]|nr:TldD/PmbA family protein [Armatimonadota bacterium]MDR7426405.1 TldD/PmbA family protein [Armatimonadota bacterium]MDR7465413.1 TldD/PmbA family protein [Armatimonadota bacterium]MDR7469536.1 TldD/PmbA family protein [Armatimonadota bacterium]MDR7473456.1 TldD/PmbA family protein [Armatimonadota bacterium]